MKAVLFFLLITTTVNSFSQKEKYSIQNFQTLPGLSIRALEVINDSTVWFAANRGVFGYTENGGRLWHIDSIKVDSLYPEFRSIAVLNDSTVLLLSISSPAYLFKTTDKGKNWRLVYTDKRKEIFFDSMKFWDDKNGMALGDPIDGKIQLINTHNGGESWKPVARSSIPELEEGESFFAASNSCFALYGNHSWIATGGERARVIYSPNGGKSHLSQETSILEGSEMSGIFSIDFRDKKTGAVTGGNYDKSNPQYCVLGITKDSGKNWKCLKFPELTFGSCVQFLNKDEIFLTNKEKTFLVNITTKEIREIRDETGNSLGFHTLRVSPSGNVVWLAGGEGKLMRLVLKKE